MPELTSKGSQWLGSFTYGSGDHAGTCSWQRNVSPSEFSGVLSIDLTDTGDVSAAEFQRELTKQLKGLPSKPGSTLTVSPDGLAYFEYVKGEDPQTGKKAQGCSYSLAVEPKLSLDITYQYFPGTSDVAPKATTAAGACQVVIGQLLKVVAPSN